MDEQQEQTPHKEEYTPRPKSQVWLARIGLVAFLLVLAYFYLSLFGGK